MTTIIMLTSCIALLLACAAFVAQELLTFHSSLVSELSTLADITGKNCVASIRYDDSEKAEAILANLRAESQIIAACIYKDG
jgi:uncharacterized membrane protein affecting hemolysin expression